MNLAKDERKHRTFKVYLIEPFKAFRDDCYVITDSVIIPNYIVDHIASNDDNDLPIIYIKEEVRFEDRLVGEFLRFSTRDYTQKAVYIPAKLVQKIEIKEETNTILTPQYSPVEKPENSTCTLRS